ncbi:Aqualysin-1 [Lasiodiplodia hormozganensis]|uniref:Aqualysin-1 n=1 Tax=Lasiodiplodia hormozganensis TaxID=869390 RepID=A0AA39XUB7_9PEZI|nr:Aqualysin-1 [Lasiodiplodia hormozganensis]
MKATTALLFLAAAVTATAAAAPSSPQAHHQHARRQNAKEYDVLTTPDADIAALLASSSIADDDAVISATFDNPRFRGFSGAFTDEEVAALRAADGVVVSVREAVEEKMVVPEVRRRRRMGMGGKKKREVVEKRQESGGGVESRDDATWGLQRISQEGKVEVVGGSTTGRGYTYTWKDTSTLGAGVDIYVMDSGIYTEHEEFGGRAIEGYNFYPDQPGDKFGHGSHCAGSAAGSTVGVATNASLISVKVISDDGLGSTSGYLGGIDWILSRHANRSTEADFVASVVSISLSWSTVFETIDTATKELTAAGLHVAIAAGNTYDDACTYSPASLGGAANANDVLVVGASTIADSILWFSSTGPCVDVYAPGAEIVSAAVTGGPTDYVSDSGTSMATPHVAGLLAVLAGDDAAGLADSPAAAKERVVALARGAGVLAQNENFVEGGEVLLVGNGVY